MAFKYIKKYKVNGKWRYVYADSKTHGAIKTAQQLVNTRTYGVRDGEAKPRGDVYAFGKQIRYTDPWTSDSNWAKPHNNTGRLGKGGEIARRKKSDYDETRRYDRDLIDNDRNWINNNRSKRLDNIRKANRLNEKTNAFIDRKTSENSVSTKVKNAGSTTLSSIKNTGSKIKSTVTRRKKK